MSIAYNTSIVTDGLVLCLDAANSKSFDARENLLLNSETFGSGWGVGDVTVANNAVLSPIGTMTADKMIESTTASAYHYQNQSITKPAVADTYTFSIYAKDAGRGTIGLRIESSGNGAIYTVNLTNGSVINVPGVYGTSFSNATGSVTQVTSDGWYRVALTVTTDAATSIYVQTYLYNTTTSSSVYTGDGTSGVYVWGAQFERANAASAYTATAGAAVTRTTSWLDLSGNGNHGTLMNTASYAVAGGGGITFDGIGDYVTVTEAANMTPQTLTFEVVCNVASANNTTYGGAPANLHYIVFRQNTRTSAFEGYFISVDDANLRFSAGVAAANGSQYGVNGTANVVIGSTYIVTMVLESTYLRLYVNGVQQAAGNKASGIDYNAGHTLKIGRAVANGTSWDAALNGTVYAAKMYNRALTAAEVSRNFNAIRGRYGI